MSDDSKYTYRFGVYGSNNPLYTDILQEVEPSTSVSGLNGVLNGNAITIDTPTNFYSSPKSGSFSNLFSSTAGSVKYERDQGAVFNNKPSILKVNLPGLNDGGHSAQKLAMQFNFSVVVSAVQATGRRYSFSSKQHLTFTVGYTDEDGKEKTTDVQSNWTFTNGRNCNVGDTVYDGFMQIEFKDDFFKPSGSKKKELKYLQFTFDAMGRYNITFENFKVTCYKGEDTQTVSKVVLVDDGTGTLMKAYTCPWELKHVDSITMSISGQTSTMGVPNKPASRTQIFDTGGPVRTFKISGRRYDWEEEVSNWDFVNTQLNVAKDSVYTDKKYVYVGMSWLLSNMQVLLKGYTFNIVNSDVNDKRFIFTAMPSTSDCITVEDIGDVPSNSDGIYTGIMYYITKEKKFYKQGEKALVEYPVPEDTGYNVALTAFSASFSESEPGLMEYSITAVERFKNGDKLYNVYKPLYED